MDNYDVIVIGGGTAGTNAARVAGKMGKRVALIHKPELLNLCVEWGCMPSKALLASSHVAHTARHASIFGLDSLEPKANFSKIMERRRTQVARFRKALDEKIADDPYQVFVGSARFLPDQAGVAIVHPDGAETTIKASRYVLATGSLPHVPPIPGLAEVPYLTSDDIMQDVLTALPDSIVIVGGGAIGLEFATFFAELGTAVTLLDRGLLLSKADPEFGQEMRVVLESQGVTVFSEAATESVTYAEDQFTLSIVAAGEKREVTASQLLVATGRVPNVHDLGLEHIGLQVQNGLVVSCDEYQCANSEVYLAGDITNEMQVLHVASVEGKVAGYNAAVGTSEKKVDHFPLNLGVIFTNPPFGSIGLTEVDAREQGIAYVTSTIRWPQTGRAITMGIEHGLWKLIVSRETGRILGSQILGPSGDDLLQQVHLCMYLSADVRDLADFYAYHPTLSEQFVQLLRMAREQLSIT